MPSDVSWVKASTTAMAIRSGSGSGTVTTRWWCTPASNTRAGVMTSWTPTPLLIPFGRRWPWAGGVVRTERPTTTTPRLAISVLWRGRLNRSTPWPGAPPCSLWPGLRPSPWCILVASGTGLPQHILAHVWWDRWTDQQLRWRDT